MFETESDSAGGYKTHDSQPFGDIEGIKRWRWSADQRSNNALLHAKVLIIDGERPPVGSANLTQRALTASLEASILVRDPAVAKAMEDHVRELMSQRILVPA